MNRPSSAPRAARGRSARGSASGGAELDARRRWRACARWCGRCGAASRRRACPACGRAPWGRGIEDALDLVQRGAGAEIQRGHGGKLGVGEIQQEPVLVEDRLARPAAGAVELHDEAVLVHELDLVDAVLEGAEREAAAGVAEPACLDRVEDAVRGEGEEGRVGLGGDTTSSVPDARSAGPRRRVAARARRGRSAKSSRTGRGQRSRRARPAQGLAERDQRVGARRLRAAPASGSTPPRIADENLSPTKGPGYLVGDVSASAPRGGDYSLRGQIAEALVESIFRRAGYRVSRVGGESVPAAGEDRTDEFQRIFLLASPRARRRQADHSTG